MNLTSLLRQRAAAHPDRLALIDSKGGRDRKVSFRELERRVATGSVFLQRAGLKSGMTILAFQPVSIELYEFLLAAFRSGLRVMLADPSAGGSFLSQCCRRLPPDAFFGSWKAQWLRLSIKELRRIPRAIVCGGYFPGAKSWDTRGDAGTSLLDVPDEEPALITFTSGSTGAPKAAVRTHSFLLAQHRALSESLDFEEGEVDLITLPVFVLANLASGLTSVLAATNLAKPGEPDAAAVHAQCMRLGVTRCAASPAFFSALLSSPEGIPPFQKIDTGGAPVFPGLLERLGRALPSSRIHSVYGSTEAEPIAHFSAKDLDAETLAMTRKGGGLCAGAPVPFIRLRIMKDQWGTPLGPFSNEAFDDLRMPAGQAGEIIVSGDHVLPGYLDGVGDTETKIHVEGTIWHRTGDAGWIDEKGRVWLLGRASEKLPPGAAPASGLPADALRYPFAIECAMLDALPECRTAALEWQGKRTLVVGRELPSEKRMAIRQFAAGVGIESVHFTWNIPLDRRHQAKIDYPALRERLSIAGPSDEL